jgi:hypothetical protein
MWRSFSAKRDSAFDERILLPLALRKTETVPRRIENGAFRKIDVTNQHHSFVAADQDLLILGKQLSPPAGTLGSILFLCDF